MRDIPIFTFINKMDREARDPYELMQEIEQVLGIATYPINWPIGSGKDFKGVYEREKGRVLSFSYNGIGHEAAANEAGLDDPALENTLAPRFTVRCRTTWSSSTARAATLTSTWCATASCRPFFSGRL